MIKIIPWLLTGALAASTGLNIYHAQGAASEAPAAGVPCGGTPVAVVKTIEISGGKRSCCPSPADLCLTVDQRQQFEACCPTYFRTRAELETKLDELLDTLEEELNATDPKQGRIYELADEIGKVRTGELKSRIRTILQVRQALTPEQLVKLIAVAKGK